MNDPVTAKSSGLLCPACQVDLAMSERQGIEIDYCPRCRGVWLDRGELDKIIERNAADQSGTNPGPSVPPAQPFQPRDYGGHGASGGGHHGGGYSRGRGHGTFLGRLFD